MIQAICLQEPMSPALDPDLSGDWSGPGTDHYWNHAQPDENSPHEAGCSRLYEKEQPESYKMRGYVPV